MKEAIQKGVEALLDNGQDTDTVNQILGSHLPSGYYASCQGRKVLIYDEKESLFGIFEISIEVKSSS